AAAPGLRCSALFFRAEDGIRGFHVTGVQTCALPIWLYPGAAGGKRGKPIRIGNRWTSMDLLSVPGDMTGDGRPDLLARKISDGRSEERRVGTERRPRRAADAGTARSHGPPGPTRPTH